MSIKKDVRKQYHIIVRMYILWSNDRFRLNDSLLVTFTRIMPFSFSHVFKTLLQNKVVYLPLKLLCSICLFFPKREYPCQYSHNITHNKGRLQAQGLTVDVGLWCRKTSPQCCDERQRRGMMSLPNIHFLPTHYSYSHH